MVSTLSMALVEFLKGVLDIRRWYQQWRLATWIQGKAFNDLVFLAIGDWKSLDALCSQPIEKMMGEIQLAAILFSVTSCLAAVTQDGHVTGEKFLFGLVSGIVSPFVKDLASNLSQFAGKS